MKIGIMSMQRILNYGSFMQALSLKRILEKLGHTVVFVDYVAEPIVSKRKDRNARLHSTLRYVKFKTEHIPIVKKVLSRRIKPGDLCEKYKACYGMLNMDEKYRFHTKVDVLVIGSDEVFNCLQNGKTVGFSMELFGKNNRAKRVISYAASFGNTTLPRLEQYQVSDIVKANLKNFFAISVRDQNSFSIVETLIKTAPHIHFDPVLIGGVEEMEWEPVKTTGRYVAVYGYRGRFSETEGEEIQKQVHAMGLKTVSIMDVQPFCDEVLQCSPKNILSYIKDAEYVITDTFHGIIFSVIYHKPFAVFCRKKSDTGSTNAEKLLDLLQRLDLTDHIIENVSDIPQILKKEIDYSKVDKIRNEERKKALRYLEENCRA
ncbi:MAG: polysaccharide pyruvyl transferase family protein [Clostridia bacterium]|nr:polysaccharide pyruvyl transferase family protein [Clostridia bacterium]